MITKEILEMIIKEYERKFYLAKHVFKRVKRTQRINKNQRSSCYCMYYLAVRDDFLKHREFLWRLKYLKMFFEE